MPAQISRRTGGDDLEAAAGEAPRKQRVAPPHPQLSPTAAAQSPARRRRSARCRKPCSRDSPLRSATGKIGDGSLATNDADGTGQQRGEADPHRLDQGDALDQRIADRIGDLALNGQSSPGRATRRDAFGQPMLLLDPLRQREHGGGISERRALRRILLTNDLML